MAGRWPALGYAMAVLGRFFEFNRNRSARIRRAFRRPRLRCLDAGWLANGRRSRLALPTGNPRPTVNMLWEVMGSGASFFCARRLVQTAMQARSLVAIMIALALGLSALAYHQYFVRNPADRAEYAADPDGMLRRNGQWYQPGAAAVRRLKLGSKARSRWARSLANSLAGLLTPWFVLLVAMMLFGGAHFGAAPGSKLSIAFRAGVLAAFVFGCYCSPRAAALGFGALAGCGGLAALAGRKRFLTPRLALAGALALAALVAAAVLARGLDREVLTEAGKSLGYRLQYWCLSCAMIADYPWSVWAGKLSRLLHRVQAARSERRGPRPAQFFAGASVDGRCSRGAGDASCPDPFCDKGLARRANPTESTK